MPLRLTLAIPLLLATVLAGCNGPSRALAWNARNRPVARASAGQASQPVRAVRLGAGDSLGEAVFHQYAKSSQDRPVVATGPKEQPVPGSAMANR